METDSGRVTGSREPSPSSCAADLGPSGFDPAREQLFAFGPFKVLVTPKRVDLEDPAVGCIVLDHRTAREMAAALLIALGDRP